MAGNSPSLAGPAGSALAARLCDTASKPAVLLLEAGGRNDDVNLRVDGKRWLTYKNENMNWGYKTVPQKQCLNREIDYSRGLGLGGSSAINFGVYTIGSRDDYEEWANVTHDESFSWKDMQRRYKSLETFDRRIPPGVSTRYASPSPDDHGDSGRLHVGYAPEWERDLPALLDVFEQAGLPLNPDHNSGNPIGMSVLINSSQGGLRSTARDLITPQPRNLTVLTDSPVQRVVLKDNRAIGVESNNRICKFYKWKQPLYG